MGKQHTGYPPGRIGRGFLLSVFLHAAALAPLVIWLFVWADFGDDQVGVTFEDVKDDELPADLPAVETPPEPRKQRAVAEKAKAPEPADDPEKKTEPDKPAELAQRDPEPPKPEPPKPEPPKAEDKPKAEEVDLLHQKIVDLDMGKEVDEPLDAKYLAQRNNRALRETRAKHTNLDMATQGPAPAGGAPEDTVAHLREQEQKEGRRGPDSIAQGQPRASEPRATLSMRLPGVERVGERGEVVPESPDGLLSRPRPGQPGRKGDRDIASLEDALRPHLTSKGYASSFGDDAALAAAFAKQAKSKHKGRFTEHKEKVLSALENFISEVTPDNQTELNTRAAPFAQFIARMHRQIHETWAFGFLQSLNMQWKDTPLDDMRLLAKLEIVLDKEGQVDKIAMVRTSGNTGFDAAAISSVYSASPFPVPPEGILSGNGKVYLHWKFHRNGDACGTPGVSYFILDNGDRLGRKRKQPSSVAPDPKQG